MTLQLTKKYNFDLIFDSQKVFRLILEAMSNPGRVVSIHDYARKLYGGYSALLAIAMTLLDNEVSFNTSGDHLLLDVIASMTLSKRENIDTADFIFVCNPYDIKKVIENAKCGTLADPHKSATVIIQNDGGLVSQLTLLGPGIDGQAKVPITQTVKDAIALRDAQNYEYPQGIDLLFISDEGELFAIPRLTWMEESK